jgi:hypothetical protein
MRINNRLDRQLTGNKFGSAKLGEQACIPQDSLGPEDKKLGASVHIGLDWSRSSLNVYEISISNEQERTRAGHKSEQRLFEIEMTTYIGGGLVALEAREVAAEHARVERKFAFIGCIQTAII